MQLYVLQQVGSNKKLHWTPQTVAIFACEKNTLQLAPPVSWALCAQAKNGDEDV